MENQLRNLFQYSRDAVLFVRDRRVIFANSSAAELFGRDVNGEPASRHVPAQLLDYGADSFVSGSEISGRPCTVTAGRMADVLVLSIQPESAAHSNIGFLSDGLTSSMTSALCNIGFSMNQISRTMEKEKEQKHEQEQRRDDKLSSYMSILYHNYYTLKRLVGNLSSALAFDTGTAAFLPHPTDLALLCSNLVSTCSLLLKDQASIGFSTTLGELIAKADPNLIERLLLNLIVNSSAHTPPGGKITVGLKSRSGKAIISVDDNGSGIPPQVLKNIFTGYKLPLADDLTREPSGGLGLWICRSIAERHGGSIIIESREGEGTRVRVMLPLAGNSFADRTLTPDTGMDDILTELSGVLKSSDYTRQLLD
ncbi:MAG: ATP-binding protein [Butyricicoccus sp.]|nr:ATP-binding protein [Butyricicoccus sp.]